jgi:hypothetical protein
VIAPPVWTYWEGPLPNWISKTLETIAVHTKHQHALDPATFDALRDTDRDIDLEPLYVAHRADFIRAFLLSRYGGLWVDADCIVLQDLDKLVESFEPYDLVTYREREGNVTVSFVYARESSAIAARWYSRVCSVLRSGVNRDWTTLGGQALQFAMNETSVARHELPTAAIQPIPWQDAAAFLALGTDEDHASRVDRSTICYMLSNHAIQSYLHGREWERLDQEGSLFTYLVALAKTV